VLPNQRDSKVFDLLKKFGCEEEASVKQIDLPLIKMSTGVGAALSQLRKAKRSALLSEYGGKYHLFTAGNIAAGRSKGSKKLSDLESIVKLLPMAEPKITVKRTGGGAQKKKGLLENAKPRAGRSPQSGMERAQIAKFLGKSASGYVLRNIAGKSAFLGVKSVNVALKFVSSPKDLCCDGPRHHDDFPPPDVSVGDPCPRRDGHKIISAR
jgi:hypothetical protein